MAATEDIELIRLVRAHAIELYRELTGENGAPTLGTQNQIVDFILADPELREAVARWGQTAETDEATTRPPRCLPYDAAYWRIRNFAQSRIDQAGIYAAATGARRSALSPSRPGIVEHARGSEGVAAVYELDSNWTLILTRGRYNFDFIGVPNGIRTRVAAVKEGQIAISRPIMDSDG